VTMDMPKRLHHGRSNLGKENLCSKFIEGEARRSCEVEGARDDEVGVLEQVRQASSRRLRLVVGTGGYIFKGSICHLSVTSVWRRF